MGAHQQGARDAARGCDRRAGASTRALSALIGAACFAAATLTSATTADAQQHRSCRAQIERMTEGEVITAIERSEVQVIDVREIETQFSGAAARGGDPASARSLSVEPIRREVEVVWRVMVRRKLNPNRMTATYRVRSPAGGDGLGEAMPLAGGGPGLPVRVTSKRPRRLCKWRNRQIVEGGALVELDLSQMSVAGRYRLSLDVRVEGL